MYRKHSPQQSPTMILFLALRSLTTMLNTLYGISTTPTCSSANEAFSLAFTDKTSITLISLDDCYVLNHAKPQQQEPCHHFLFNRHSIHFDVHNFYPITLSTK